MATWNNSDWTIWYRNTDGSWANSPLKAEWEAEPFYVHLDGRIHSCYDGKPDWVIYEFFP